AEGRKDLFRLLRFSQPIRSSPKFIKANSIVWMTPNERVGAWMPLGRVCVIGFGKRGSAGTRAREDRKEKPLLTLGRRGGAPHQAANGGLSSAQRWVHVPTSPAGLAYIIKGVSLSTTG